MDANFPWFLCMAYTPVVGCLTQLRLGDPDTALRITPAAAEQFTPRHKKTGYSISGISRGCNHFRVIDVRGYTRGADSLGANAP